MAITTLDGVVAGYQQPVFTHKVGATMEAAGVLHTFIYSSGTPGACVANGEALAGAAVVNTYAGMIPYTNPSSGNGYLAKFAVASTQIGSFFLIDRLWHNDTIAEATTTAQTITSATWPARDINGSTNGVGVMVGIEVSTATTGGAVTNTTLDYTNSSGTASRTGTIASFPATAVAGTFVPFQLQAGDVGVRSIQGLTLGTTYGTGTIHLVAYRVLAGPLAISISGTSSMLDFVGTGMVRLYDNTSPQILVVPNATTAITYWTQLQWLHG